MYIICIILYVRISVHPYIRNYFNILHITTPIIIIMVGLLNKCTIVIKLLFYKTKVINTPCRPLTKMTSLKFLNG